MKLPKASMLTYAWALLAAGTIWLHYWFATIAYGLISCAIGTLILVSSPATDPQRRPFRITGLLILLFGALISIIGMFDRFVLQDFGSLQPGKRLIRIVCL